MNYSAPLRRVRSIGAVASSNLALACCFVSTIFLVGQSPMLLYLGLMAALIYLRFPQIVLHPWFQKIGGMQTIGILGGTLIFAAIALHGDPAQIMVRLYARGLKGQRATGERPNRSGSSNTTLIGAMG
jgi:hypothetical protein